MNADFLDALKQIEKEKDIPMETLIETIEAAIASAYKKAFSEAAEIRLRPDQSKKGLRLCCEKQVVETVENPHREMGIGEARRRDPTIKVGDTVRWTDRTTGEPHTVTFLGGTEPPEDVLIEPQEGGPPKLIQNYQSFLPIGESTFDGNGYRNSGFLGLPPEVGEMFGLLGDSYELTFTAPGEYGYYCILHAGGPDDEGRMIGKVTVEE